MLNLRNTDRKVRLNRSAVIETLELRRFLSIAAMDPVAFPLHLSVRNVAAPATGTLADGTTSPQSSVFSPAQIRSIYGINNIKLNGVTGTGAGQTIAIVSAYDNPDLVSSTASNFSSSDLHLFDRQFGIPDPPSFTKIEQTINGATPAPNTAWAEEDSLDVEWAHAIAPSANIILVEANSANASQLLNYGVRTAASLAGVSVVTMSFGFSEFSGETQYDAVFTTPAGHTGVTFISSTGDSGVPGTYPAFSPNVLAVGGTHLVAPNGNYSSETVYSGSGGGISSYESKPSYQSSVTQSASKRSTPDVSFDGDPNTGVDVYDSYNGGYAGKWYQIAGTSFSSPAWAGLIAIANQGRAAAGLSPLIGNTQTLPAIYAASSSDFHDIISGSNGDNAGRGYDLASGRGTPIANLLVPAIAGVSTASSGTASIAGDVYVDANGDGKLDSGEVGMSGVELFIDLKQTGSLVSGDPTSTTGSGGTYSFTGLTAGIWQVREIVPAGYQLTHPQTGFFDITVQNGWKITGENFGNQKITSAPAVVCSVAGNVYTDTNSNGKMDSGETGLAGVTIFIDTNDDGKLDDGENAVVTSSTGAYKFSFTTPGVYKLVEVVPSGRHLTSPKVGYYNVTLQTGWNVTGENWGNVR